MSTGIIEVNMHLQVLRSRASTTDRPENEKSLLAQSMRKESPVGFRGSQPHDYFTLRFATLLRCSLNRRPRRRDQPHDNFRNDVGEELLRGSVRRPRCTSVRPCGLVFDFDPVARV
jgi:hypothetical protein